MRYPRVLIVCQNAVNARSGIGITFESLFRGWPASQLAQVYHDVSEPDPTLMYRSWKLSMSDVRAIGPIWTRLATERARTFVRRGDGVPEFLQGAGSSPDFLRAILRGAIVGYADLVPYGLGAGFWRWLREFDPELVFSPMASVRMIHLVESVLRRIRVPLVPFFCDDWPNTAYTSGPSVLPVRAAMRRSLTRVLRSASIGMTGSFGMAEEYEKQFGLAFKGFMKTAEVPSIFPAVRTAGAHEVVRFVYVGGLHLERWRLLRETGLALQRLDSEGVRGELVVHAPAQDLAKYSEQLTLPPVMRAAGTLPADRVADALQHADAVVHVESFDPTLARFTRLSLSTKISQYMASGRPIFVVAPDSLESARYVVRSGAGLAVSRWDQASLCEALARLITDASLREKLGRAGWTAATANHERDRVRESFRGTLERAVEASR